MDKVLRRLLSRVNDVKIRKKLMSLYLFCVVIPIIIINFFFYIRVSQNEMDKEMDNLNLSMDRIRMSFSTSIEQSIGICEIINVDKRLNQSLDTLYSSSSAYIDEYRSNLETEVNKFIIAYNHMSMVTIYVDNSTIVNGGNYAYLSGAIRETEMYQTLFSQSKPQLLMQLTTGGNNPQKVISVISKANFYHSPYQKFIRIDLNNNMLDRIAMNEKAEGNLYLLNEKNQTIFKYIRNKSQDMESVASIQQSGQKGNDIIVVKNFGTSGPLEGWRLVGVFSNANLVSSLRESGSQIILLAAILFIIATFILLIISYSIEKRLKVMSSYLKSPRAAEHLALDIEPGKDEIGSLIVELNNGAARTRRLIDVVYKGEIEKAKAELLALQSQIHPHFLYNTLNSIRLKSMLKGELETASVIKRLALLFRRIMSWEEEFITVQEEVAFIVDFLEIQKYRYEEKLSYRISVEDEALTCRIPKMVLQPLIENASFHGIEMSEQEGVIELIIRIRNNALYCIVKDNGIGIPEDKLRNINKFIGGQSGDTSDSIGIYNVYKRLRFYYEDKMRLRVASFAGKGTSVVIRIQMVQK